VRWVGWGMERGWRRRMRDGEEEGKEA
jgi:hypothetical protein